MFAPLSVSVVAGASSASRRGATAVATAAPMRHSKHTAQSRRQMLSRQWRRRRRRPRAPVALWQRRSVADSAPSPANDAGAVCRSSLEGAREARRRCDVGGGDVQPRRSVERPGERKDRRHIRRPRGVIVSSDTAAPPPAAPPKVLCTVSVTTRGAAARGGVTRSSPVVTKAATATPTEPNSTVSAPSSGVKPLPRRVIGASGSRRGRSPEERGRQRPPMPQGRNSGRSSRRRSGSARPKRNRR